MIDSKTIENLIREFVDAACECEVRDFLISEHAERIEQAIATTLVSDREAKLESLARSLYADYCVEWPERAEEVYAWRMQELGIEANAEEHWHESEPALSSEAAVSTCSMTKLERSDGMEPGYRCSECGHENYEYDFPSYCPKCGKRSMQ